MITWGFGALAYLAFSLFRARIAYRREYAKLKEQRVPAVYGHGWMSPKEKSQEALRESVWDMILWPITDLWTITGYALLGARWLAVRIITGPRPPEFDLDYSKIARMEEEILPEVPAATEPCPCGYTTECPIHCGDGSRCHDVMFWTLDATERRAVRNTFHPEIGTRTPEPEINRVHHPELLTGHLDCGGFQVFRMRDGSGIVRDNQGHVWEDRL